MSVILKNINKSFGAQRVLKDVSLTIEDGSIVGLLGPNGAGKSTLMKILVGLWHPDSGDMHVPSTSGYLPEHNPLYEEMYVREYLLFQARLEHVANVEETVANMISRVGLTPEVHKKISQLSKGYRQRVGLAQALLGNPDLLVLDEPTTGLDPNQLEDVRMVIKESGKHRTVILSTHILDEVRKMCTHVIILDKGEIKLFAPIGEIRDLEEEFRVKTGHK